MTTITTPCPVEAIGMTPAIRAELERQGCLTPEIQVTALDIKADLTKEQADDLDKQWGDPAWGIIRRGCLFTLTLGGQDLLKGRAEDLMKVAEEFQNYRKALEHQMEMATSAFSRVMLAAQFLAAKEAVEPMSVDRMADLLVQGAVKAGHDVLGANKGGTAE